VRHRTVSGALPRHPVVRDWSWSTVGGFVLMRHRTVWCHTGQSGAPLTFCSDFCRGTVLHCSFVRVDRCVQIVVALLVTGQSGGTPDSPVNYSGTAPGKPEAEGFGVYGPWCTGHCPVAHQTVRCARPGKTLVSFLLLSFEP
jgi:hypothetical protein